MEFNPHAHYAHKVSGKIKESERKYSEKQNEAIMKIKRLRTRLKRKHLKVVK